MQTLRSKVMQTPTGRVASRFLEALRLSFKEDAENNGAIRQFTTAHKEITDQTNLLLCSRPVQVQRCSNK